jgi:hypothetical protein
MFLPNPNYKGGNFAYLNMETKTKLACHLALRFMCYYPALRGRAQGLGMDGFLIGATHLQQGSHGYFFGCNQLTHEVQYQTVKSVRGKVANFKKLSCTEK